MVYHGTKITPVIAMTIVIPMILRGERRKKESGHRQSHALARDACITSRKMGAVTTFGVRGVSIVGIGALWSLMLLKKGNGLMARDCGLVY